MINFLNPTPEDHSQVAIEYSTTEEQVSRGVFNSQDLIQSLKLKTDAFAGIQIRGVVEQCTVLSNFYFPDSKHTCSMCCINKYTNWPECTESQRTEGQCQDLIEATDPYKEASELSSHLDLFSSATNLT